MSYGVDSKRSKAQAERFKRAFSRSALEALGDLINDSETDDPDLIEILERIDALLEMKS